MSGVFRRTSIGRPALANVRVVLTNEQGYPALRDKLREMLTRVHCLLQVTNKHTIPADLVREFKEGYDNATVTAENVHAEDYFQDKGKATKRYDVANKKIALSIMQWHNYYRCFPNDDYPPLSRMVELVFSLDLLGCTGSNEPIPAGVKVLADGAQWKPTPATNALVVVYETLFIFNQATFGFTLQPGLRSFVGMALSYTGSEELAYKTEAVAIASAVPGADDKSAHATHTRNTAKRRNSGSAKICARTLKVLLGFTDIRINYSCHSSRHDTVTGFSISNNGSQGFDTGETIKKATMTLNNKAAGQIFRQSMWKSNQCRIGIGNDAEQLQVTKAAARHFASRH